MTPARIRELRRAGVLDGSRADAARIALLDLHAQAWSDYARQRGSRLPADELLAGEILFCLDVLMRDTPQGRALRWARTQARRRARRRS